MSTNSAVQAASPRAFVVGLGANLGDRLATLRSAVQAAGRLGRLVDVSWLYETQAIGPPQPDYLNAAMLLETSAAPAELLAGLLEIEHQHGRERRERWGPRTLDLDLLFSPSLVIEQPGLRLPHPELTRRAFALFPLLDVTPHALEPRSGRRYAALARELDPASVHRLETAGAGRAEWVGHAAAGVGLTQ